MGTRFSDGDAGYLRATQYADSRNVGTRIGIHERYSTNPLGWLPWLFGELDLPAPAAVLDVGCGPAGLWTRNAARVPAGWRLTLTDFSPGMLADARSAMEVAGVPATFAVLDAGEPLPFRDGSFDAVLANHVLYQVANRAGAIAEIARVLRPDGVLYASTNGVAHLRELDGWLAEVTGLDPDDTARQFGLENGAAQLSAAFGDVELRRYPDELAIPDVEVALGFLRSMAAGAALDPGQEAALRAVLEEARERGGGAVRVTKDAGVFVAQLPLSAHRGSAKLP